jgi:hypothetical protein
VNPTLTIACYGVGAAVVACWLVVRLPGFGPRSVRGAVLLTAVAFVAQAPFLGLVNRAVSGLGAAGALLLVILPSLTLLFWACGCLVRSLVAPAAPYRR